MMLGFGEALIDVLPSGEVVGGAPLNFSIRASELAARLGYPVALATRIGADSRGQKISDLLNSRQVSTDYVQLDPKHPTGYVDVEIHDGEASYQFGPDVAWDHITWNEELQAAAAQCQLVCFGSLAQRSAQTRATLQHFLESADKAIKLFDINLRQPLPAWETILQSLQQANVLKCNESELEWLASKLGIDSSNAEKTAASLLSHFELDCVFWTRGQNGCILQNRQETVLHQGELDLDAFGLPECEADSVGAGDATAAALAIGLQAKWPTSQIVRAANLCGAYAANSRGATAKLPEKLLDQIFADG